MKAVIRERWRETSQLRDRAYLFLFVSLICELFYELKVETGASVSLVRHETARPRCFQVSSSY